MTVDMEQIIREEVRAALQGADLGKAAEAAALHGKVLLTVKEVQLLYGFSPGTLADLRAQGRGPRYIQTSATAQIRYRRADLDEFLSRKAVRTYDCQ